MNIIFGQMVIFLLIWTITFHSSAAYSNEAVKGYDSYYSSSDRSLLILWEYAFEDVLWIRCYFNDETPKINMTAASHVFSYQHQRKEDRYFKHLQKRGSYILLPGSFQLYINKPSSHDEGYYKCEFRSSDSKMTIHGTSRVKQSVKFMVKGQSSSFISGDDTVQLEWFISPKHMHIERVRCSHKKHQGSYRLLITYTVENMKWTAVGSAIMNAQYEKNLGRFTLIIDSPAKRDTGDYLCEFFGPGNREMAVVELANHVPLHAIHASNSSFCPDSSRTNLVWSLSPSDATVYGISCVFLSSKEKQSLRHKVYSLDIRSGETEVHGYWTGRVNHILKQDEFLLVIIKPGVRDVGRYKCAFRGAKDTHHHDEVYLEEDTFSCENSAADRVRSMLYLTSLFLMFHLEFLQELQ